MDIYDAHMHLPVHGSTMAEKRAALFAEMKRNGINGGVVISDSELKSTIGSLQECCELFANCPDIAVVGGISPFINFQEQLALLESYLSKNMARGIKLYSGHEPIYLDDAVLEPVYKTAEKYGVPVLFHSGWDNPQYSAPEVIQRAVKTYPRVTFVCCHCCYPNLSECFSALAEYENLLFDISSIADDFSTASKLKPVVERAIHAMPERFLFGSDHASCDQHAHVAFCDQLVLSDRERMLLYQENAERIYLLSQAE